MEPETWTLCGESHTISEWANILGLARRTLEARKYRGWPVERILTESTTRVMHGHCIGSHTIGKRSKTYNSWAGMIQRCLNPKNAKYPKYGGRGIRVAPCWLKFKNFLADMGERPSGTSIHRSNDGNYEPGQCCWATVKEQGNNTRHNHLLELRGERHTISEWSMMLGIDGPTLRKRLKLGWTVERALTKALRTA